VSRLLAEGILPAEAERLANFDKMVTVQTRSLEIDIELTRSAIERAKALGLSTAEMEKQLALAEARLEGVQGAAAAGPGQGPTTVDRLREATNAVRGELNTLMDPVNQIVGAANAIGDSFGNAFKGVISGSMSAKEALAGFFQSLADYFLDMAAKIIAKWIQMTILNSVLKLFPGGSLLSAASPEVGAIGQGSSIFAAANGATFANGIVPYAKGGIVNSPTLFKFAKGGAMQTGIMGEAGAEAVMPLKRGPDGKLGVAATGGGGVNVVVNVDAKGSAVQGDQGQGNELGRVIAGAVQAELIKQQRPGGLLTR
jgi:hypothetical protein